MLNKIILIGRLTKDPEVKVLQSGSSVCNFTLAVRRDFRDRNGEKGTDFIPVVVWGRTVDYCSNYLSKGMLADVSGRLQTRSYDKSDGTRAYITEVNAESVHSLETRQKSVREEPLTEPQQYGFDEVDEDWEYSDNGDMPF